MPVQDPTDDAWPEFLQALMQNFGASQPGGATPSGAGPRGLMPGGGVLNYPAATPGAPSMGYPAMGRPSPAPAQPQNGILDWLRQIGGASGGGGVSGPVGGEINMSIGPENEPQGSPSATPRPAPHVRGPLAAGTASVAPMKPKPGAPNLGYYRPTPGNARVPMWVPFA